MLHVTKREGLVGHALCIVSLNPSEETNRLNISLDYAKKFLRWRSKDPLIAPLKW